MNAVYTTISIDAHLITLLRKKADPKLIKKILSHAIALASSHKSGVVRNRGVRYQKISSSLARIHLSLPADNYEILCSLRCSGKISVSALICMALEELLLQSEENQSGLPLDSYPSFSHNAKIVYYKNRIIFVAWWEKRKKPPRKAASQQ